MTSWFFVATLDAQTSAQSQEARNAKALPA
jgi:hypothetical protein